MFLIGVAFGLRWHYRRRDWRIAIASVLIVLGASWLVSRVGPDVSLFAAVPEPTGGWASPSVTVLRRADTSLRLAESRRDRTQVVAAPVILDGLPEDYAASPFTIAGRLEYRDGARAESGHAVPVQTEARRGYRPSLTLGYRLSTLASGPTAWEVWPVLVEAPTELIKRQLGQPAAYHGTFLYRISRHERLASLPIEADATYVDGPRTLIVRAFDERDSECRVIVQVRGPSLTLATPQEPAMGYYFINRTTGQRMRTFFERTSWPMIGAFRLYPFGANGFGTQYAEVVVDHMSAPADAPAPVNRTVRCADLRLVVVRTVHAGMLTRTLTVPDLLITSSAYYSNR